MTINAGGQSFRRWSITRELAKGGQIGTTEIFRKADFIILRASQARHDENIAAVDVPVHSVLTPELQHRHQKIVRQTETSLEVRDLVIFTSLKERY